MIRNLSTGTDMQFTGVRRNESASFSSRLILPLKGKNAFTLVELIVVVAILAILALMAVPAGFEYIQKARIGRCIADIQTMNNEIQAYYIDKNGYPDSLSDIGRSTFKDPWGEVYEYVSIDIANGRDPLIGFYGLPLNPVNDYDLWSKGVDRQTSKPAYDGTCEDDIVRASDGGFIGSKRGDF